MDMYPYFNKDGSESKLSSIFLFSKYNCMGLCYSSMLELNPGLVSLFGLMNKSWTSMGTRFKCINNPIPGRKE